MRYTIQKFSTGAAHQGAVLIVVLWFLALATLLVSALAVEVRLSAKAVLNHKQAVEDWSVLLQAIHAAQMELMLQRMPPDEETRKIPLAERENPLLRFDGRELELSYPLPENVKVRIYDHAGKINLQRLPVHQFRRLMERLLGEKDPRKVDALYDAWQDWLDGDDLKRANGAEKDYYKTLSPPYEPRNGAPESVYELRLIKGFDELLKDIDVESIFTVYENRPNLNPNLASPAALALLQGAEAEDEAAVRALLDARSEEPFKNFNDLNELMTPDQFQRLRPWLNLSTGNIYTIAIQIDPPAENPAETSTASGRPGGEDRKETPAASPAVAVHSRQAYMLTVQLQRGYAAPPRVLLVNPFGQLPEIQETIQPTD